ncbi:MAG TPA: zinc ribbon domain-containing protein [Edaphobacter sp.]|nr:zinc ribbon domain-containing protein [Edaphobacter sp.]
MICQSCGTPIAIGSRFCPKCGAQVAAPVPPPQPMYPMYPPRPPRVLRNLQILGILWCIFGAYRIVAGLIAITVLRMSSWSHYHYGFWGWHSNVFFWPPWMDGLLPLVFLISGATAVLAFIAGFGLLSRRSWARVLAIVLAILALLKFPLGTALGIYTLWVLAPAQSRAEYDSIAEP